MIVNCKYVKCSLNRVCFAVSLAILSGCTVGPNFEQPTDHFQPITARSDYELNMPQSTAAKEVSSSQWWQVFNDPILMQLQSQAQIGNLDLQVASNRIAQSRAKLGITDADKLPSLSAHASYVREGNSENGKLVALGAPATAENFFMSGFDASWELDLWGRNKRLSERATAQLEATIYDREAARVSLAAEVAKTYFLLRSTQTQIDIANKKERIAERVVNLVSSREKNGVGTRFDTISAQSQLASSKAVLPELQQRAHAQMNALALLLGEQPRALESLLTTPTQQLQLPQGMFTSIPSNLAQHRPDILKAEANLHSAVASIGAAKANFYPSISLVGSVGLEAFDGEDLASWDSRAFSIGPKVYLPLFQGGRLTQQLELSKEKQKNAALGYRKVVLTAWHEVDNAIDGWLAQQNHHQKLFIANEYAQLALHTIDRSYQQGAADNLSVLAEQAKLLDSQSRLNYSATNGALAVINVYKSLGGGWDNSLLDDNNNVDLNQAEPNKVDLNKVAMQEVK